MLLELFASLSLGVECGVSFMRMLGRNAKSDRKFCDRHFEVVSVMYDESPFSKTAKSTKLENQLELKTLTYLSTKIINTAPTQSHELCPVTQIAQLHKNSSLGGPSRNAMHAKKRGQLI